MNIRLNSNVIAVHAKLEVIDTLLFPLFQLTMELKMLQTKKFGQTLLINIDMVICI